jgi:cytochrome bd-type quinol oxidase subunit 2
MVRAIVGVIVGYLVMAMTIGILFGALWLVLGAEGAFKEGTYQVTPVWIISTFVLSLIAATVGGIVCAVISTRGSKAPVALMVVVLILGAPIAVFEITSGREQKPLDRPDEIAMAEATSNARQPTVALMLNPIIGAIGVYLGASLTRRARADEPSAPASPA